MRFPPWFERFQIKYLNPPFLRAAPYLPGLAIVKHRGRSSGKAYETVVAAYRKGDILAITLAHGKTNWVKNVLAAGKADVRVGGKDVHVVNPRLVFQGDEDPALPDSVRKMAKRVGVFVADIA